MAEYRLAPAAVSDLEAIWIYTAKQWGIEQAHRYIDTLTAAFAELAHTPKIASTCDHIRPGYRRWNVERHVIFFRMTSDGIAVIRILHDSMDAPRHLATN